MAYDDPYARAALARRSVGAPILPDAPDPYAALIAARAPVTAEATADPNAVQDTTSQFGRGLRRSAYSLAAAVPALAGAGANLIAPGSGDSALDTSAGLSRRGAELGPRVASYNDVHNLKDVGDYAAGFLGSALPDVALALTGGGLGGLAVKGIARRAGVEAATTYAERKVAERGVGELSADVVKAQGEDAARRAATASAVEQETARVTPRFVQAAEQGISPAVVKAGQIAGTTAGMFPSTVAGSVEGAPDANGNLVGGLKGASSGDTAKILLGDLGAAAAGSLPEVRLLGKIGGPAATDAIAASAKQFFPRVAKEAAVQGALGGAAGVAQTATQYAAHKWVNDNVDLMSPTAFHGYLDALIGGGVLGAGLGGAVEGAHAIHGALGALGAPDTTALRSKIRENLGQVADWRRAAFEKAKTAAGDSVDALKSKFGKGDGPAPGEPMAGDEGAAAATGAAADFATNLGEKVGVAAGQLHAHAVDLFGKLQGHLKTDEGKASVSGAFANAVSGLKDKFNTDAAGAGFEAMMQSYKQALVDTKSPTAQHDVQQAYGKVLEDMPPSPAAKSSFDGHLSDLNDTETLDGSTDSVLNRMSQRFETGQADAPAPNDRSPSSNPVHFESRLQNQLATIVPADSPLWAFPETLHPIMKSAEKLFTDPAGMTAQDHARLDVLRRFAPDKVQEWEAAAPDYAKVSEGMQKATTATDNARPDNTAVADALQKAQVADAIKAKPADLGAMDATDATANDGGHDFQPGINEATTASLTKQAPLTEQLIAAKPGTPEHAAIQDQLRTQLLKDGGLVTENRSSQNARNTWAQKDPSTHANTIEIEPVVHVPESVKAYAEKVRAESGDAAAQAVLDKAVTDPSLVRRQALQIDNLISKKLAAEPGIHGLANDRNAPLSALKAVLGDLHMAGIKVDPKSITPGEFYSNKEGNGSRMTPKEAAAIQASLTGKDVQPALPRRMTAKAKTVSAARTATADKIRTSRATRAAQARGTTVEALAREKAVVELEKQQQTEVMQGADDSRIAGPELVARKAPPANQSGVAEVRASSPYEVLVNEARALKGQKGVDDKGAVVTLRDGKSPAERATKLHEIGVKIGSAELTKQHESGMLSDRRYGLELRRLNDYSSGISRKYVTDAAAGKFDAASVRETAAENATPLKKGPLINETTDALDAAYKRIVPNANIPSSKRFNYMETVKAKVEALQKRAAKGDTLTDREHTLLSAARDAGMKVDLGEPQSEAHTARSKAADAQRPKAEVVTPKMDPSQDASERQTRNQPENPLDRTRKPLDEQAMAELTKKMQLNDPSAKEARPAVGTTPAERAKIAATAKARSDAAAKAREIKRLGDSESVDIHNDSRVKTNFVRLDDAEIQDGLKEAAKDAGPHDHVKETRLLNDVLARMSIKEKVTVRPLPTSDKTRGGMYDTGTGEIHISPNLRGAERIEVLAHELGHHVIRSELARAMGVDMKSIQDLSTHQVFEKMAEHASELHKALNADFEKWMEAHSDLGERYVNAMASRKPFHRAQGMRARNTRSTSTLGDRVRQIGNNDVGYLHTFEEYLADHISRALTHNEASPAAKFFKGIADKLKIAYDTLFKGKGGENYAPAPSVEKWVQGLFDRTTRDVSEALGEGVSAEMGKASVEAALHAAIASVDPPAPPGAPPPGGEGAGERASGPKGLKAMVTFIRGRLRPQERNVLEQALGQGKATRRLQEIYKDQPNALKAMASATHGLEARIAYGYMAWEKGLLNAGPRSASVLRSIGSDLRNVVHLAGNGDFAQRIFSDIANGTIERHHQLNRTYDVKQLEASYRGKAQYVLNAAEATYQKAAAPLGRAFNSSVVRMRATGVPAIRAIAGALALHTGETGKDSGLIAATTHNNDVFMHKAGGIVESLSKVDTLHWLNTLQQRQDKSVTGNAKVDAAIAQWRALDKRFYDYGKAAGLPHESIDKHFPVVMDITTPAKRQALTDLLSAPEFEKHIREVMGSKDKPADGKIDTLVERMVASAERRSAGVEAQPYTRDGSAPGFSGGNKRLMQFIYDHGTSEQKRAFADLQSKDVATILSRYVVPLVRKAESVRRFGSNDERLNKLLDKAKEQGATDAQIQQARDAVDGARGAIGADGSPVLRRLLGESIERKITGPRARKAIAYTQAYQNARLLPLSLISSIVDPMGIAVRTGGDFKTAWDGFKFGMKTLTNKSTRAEALSMLRMLGSADDFFTNETLQNGYGGMGDNTARKINDTIFKANGLAGWTRATRFMALQAAHGFLTKHALTPGNNSARWLAELNVRPTDITKTDAGHVRVLNDEDRAAASPQVRAADDRVRSALLRFVDEAILRPNSQQAPNWMADPYLGLVSQYKQFAYAIHDQISGRIGNEVRHGNLKVLLPTMSYLPVIVATEMLRGLIQFGPGGNPQRDNWGPEDYVGFAAMRSGLLGPKLSFKQDAIGDVTRKRLYGASLAGPSAQQAGQIVSALSGQRSIGKTFEGALPGEAAFKNWNNGAGDERGSSGLQRRGTVGRNDERRTAGNG